MPIKDRVTFRPTPDDVRCIEALAAALRTTSGTAFVSRSEVVRLALRTAAEAAARATEAG
jgi:hypothetical protein